MNLQDFDDINRAEELYHTCDSCGERLGPVYAITVDGQTQMKRSCTDCRVKHHPVKMFDGRTLWLQDSTDM